jgi:hypothetical protein
MDRRYYALKALVIVFALGFAAFGYAFGARNIATSNGHAHYSAATTMQVSAAKAGAVAGHAILKVVEFFHG